tara:strand:+ start:192 stop:1943 length:1752 start_codon:yes stop_codon:yes gene_type:complete
MSQTKAQLIDPTDGSIVNADINASAAIAGSKISPDFGSQNISTTGNIEIDSDSAELKLGDSQDFRLLHNGTDNKVIAANGGLLVQSDTYSLRNENGSSTHATIDSAGRVLIGTTSTVIGSSTEFNEIVLSGKTRGAGITLQDVDANTRFQIRTDDNGDGTLLNASTNHPIAIRTNNLERVRIDSSGKVGIGISSPAELLHLQSTAGNTKLRLTQSGSTTDAVNGTVHFGNSTDGTLCEVRGYTSGSTNSGYLQFLTTSSGSKVTAMTIATSGSVGIGTASPAAQLEVKNTGNVKIYANSSGGYIQQDVSNLDALHLISSGQIKYQSDPENDTSSTAHIFECDGSEKMRIISSGNVGIGLSAPEKPLHIFRDSADSEIRLQTNTGTDQNAYITLRNSGGVLDIYSVNSNIQLHANNNKRGTVNDTSGITGIEHFQFVPPLVGSTDGGSTVSNPVLRFNAAAFNFANSSGDFASFQFNSHWRHRAYANVGFWYGESGNQSGATYDFTVSVQAASSGVGYTQATHSFTGQIGTFSNGKMRKHDLTSSWPTHAADKFVQGTITFSRLQTGISLQYMGMRVVEYTNPA